VSLGCPKNLVDGEVMLGRLQARGHQLVADAAEADVIVVNTCAFIDRAKQESIDTILEMARLKEQGRRSAWSSAAVWPSATTRSAEGDPRDRRHAGDGQVEEILSAVEGEATVAEVDSAPTWVYDHTAPRC